MIWTHTFSPTLLNQARANAAGWRWNEVATNPQAPFGLPQDNIDGIGSINSSNIAFFGAPGPSNLNQWTYTYSDVLTKIIGRHSIKVGGDITRLYYLNNPVYAARPSFNFHNLWDFANDAPYFENGQFDSQTGIPFANRQDGRQNIWGFFGQDDIKAPSQPDHQPGPSLDQLRSVCHQAEQSGRGEVWAGCRSTDRSSHPRRWISLRTATVKLWAGGWLRLVAQ